LFGRNVELKRSIELQLEASPTPTQASSFPPSVLQNEAGRSTHSDRPFNLVLNLAHWDDSRITRTARDAMVREAYFDGRSS
jgi:hypothetical protein